MRQSSILALIPVVFGGCLQLRVSEPERPVAVGAVYRFETSNRRLQCSGLGSIDCDWVYADILSVEADPDVFAVEGDAVRAIAPGEDRVRLTADIGRKRRSRRVAVEAAAPVAVWATVGDTFDVDAVALPPGAAAGVGWRAEDASGRALGGVDFLAFDDPDGQVVVSTDDTDQLWLEAPDEPVRTTLVDDSGAPVLDVLVDADGPLDDLDLWVADETPGAPVALAVGWRDGYAVIVGEATVVYRSLTPDVCSGAPEAPLGTPVAFGVLAPGRCRIEATVEQAGGALTTTGEGRVGPAISRNPEEG